MRSLMFSLAVLTAGMPAVQARDAEGNAAIKGSGQAKCEIFIQSLNDNKQEAVLFVGWLNGFMSGINLFEEKTFDIVPWQPPAYLVALMRNYCTQNPEEPFHSAALKLARSFAPTRLAERSDVVQVPHEEGQLPIYKAVLQRVQEHLIEEGYLIGSADGLYGPATKRALEAYQQARGIEVTGIPDLNTLQSVLVVDPAREAQPQDQQD
ncbi:MAG: peptidoglycan-binding protein [Rhodothalassiaceae bacterium]